MWVPHVWVRNSERTIILRSLASSQVSFSPAPWDQILLQEEEFIFVYILLGWSVKFACGTNQNWIRFDLHQWPFVIGAPRILRIWKRPFPSLYFISPYGSYISFFWIFQRSTKTHSNFLGYWFPFLIRNKVQLLGTLHVSRCKFILD
jgi:hypothetical protein